MSTQSATDFLTFTISGNPVKVDPDIYYQIFNVRPAQRSKYAGNIIGVRMNGLYPVIITINKRNKYKSIMLSRFIMKPPKGKAVDHINGDKLDHRRENLRIVTYRQNCLNKKSRSNTGFIGVSVHKYKGRGYCGAHFRDKNGKIYFFYAPDCPKHRILAAYARDKFVLQCGDEEYAPLNFESFKYEPFRSFLLETDLSKFKIKNI